VTPFLSDRDLALQNVRYVLGAAGGLTEDFHPPRDGFIQTRARQVLGEAVELLERIVADVSRPGSAPLLAAIADGTFGLMRRPADAGKGLDGVVRRAPDYDNPAVTLLDGGPPRILSEPRREISRPRSDRSAAPEAMQAASEPRRAKPRSGSDSSSGPGRPRGGGR